MYFARICVICAYACTTFVFYIVQVRRSRRTHMAIDVKNSLRLLQMTLIVFFYLPTVLVAIQEDGFH